MSLDDLLFTIHLRLDNIKRAKEYTGDAWFATGIEIEIGMDWNGQ